jgi:hypothetical protein
VHLSMMAMAEDLEAHTFSLGSVVPAPNFCPLPLIQSNILRETLDSPHDAGA